MSKLVGVCPKCLEIKELSRHHVFPRRWFKRKEIIFFCRQCHNEVEYIISIRERGRPLDEHVYVSIIKSFLRGKSRKIIFVKRNGQKINGSKLNLGASIKISQISPAV
jgi:hypothetical protein